MTTSARAWYSVASGGGAFTYEFVIQNTSPEPFGIYAIMLGEQYSVPVTPTPLKDIVFISAPTRWEGEPEPQNNIGWRAAWQGSVAATTPWYIMPGQIGRFVFQSSTGPPGHLIFGCCFYDGVNAWGYCFNGIASLLPPGFQVPAAPHLPGHEAFINPLVFILGDELFVRLNLPRPNPILPESLRKQTAPNIHSMTVEQRETAARALAAHIGALSEVRAALVAADATPATKSSPGPGGLVSTAAGTEVRLPPIPFTVKANE